MLNKAEPLSRGPSKETKTCLAVLEEAVFYLVTYVDHDKGAARHPHSNCQDDGNPVASRIPGHCWGTCIRTCNMVNTLG